MSCLVCNKFLPDIMRFRAVEVHTLHIRDFDGERIVQALGETKEYEICTACAEREVQAVLFPKKRIMLKCLPFVLLGIIGAVLTLLLTVKNIMPVFRAIGPIAFVVGILGVVSKVRETLRERESVKKMSHDEAVRHCAWILVVKNAPKKYGDNDITYIPVNDSTKAMTAEKLSTEFDLLPAIASKLRENLT